MTNIELLEYCISHPEPLLDEDYMKDALVISSDPDISNTLMTANKKLHELITAYKVNRTLPNSTAANEAIITQAMGLLLTPNINFSEFTSFWACCDVSFTVYCGLSEADKRVFLREVIPRYIERRHDLYLSHGYSSSTLQVQADSFAHKRSGPQGAEKARRILNDLGYSPLVGEIPEQESRNHFLVCDRSNRRHFKRIIDALDISLTWTDDETGKLPDYAVFRKDSTIITEHKHMKELGGGQDKQLLEITRFLQQSDEHVSYVSYLDGVLFDRLFSPSARGKLKEQQEAIRSALSDYPRSYFLNTAGFQQLFEDFIERT